MSITKSSWYVLQRATVNTPKYLWKKTQRYWIGELCVKLDVVYIRQLRSILHKTYPSTSFISNVHHVHKWAKGVSTFRRCYSEYSRLSVLLRVTPSSFTFTTAIQLRVCIFWVYSNGSQPEQDQIQHIFNAFSFTPRTLSLTVTNCARANNK